METNINTPLPTDVPPLDQAPPAPPSSNIKKDLILGMVSFMILVAIGFGSYMFVQNKNAANNTLQDYNKAALQSDEYLKANSLATDGKYEEAFAAYEEGMKNADSQGVKSVFDITSAILRLSLDSEEGVTELVAIGNNTSYPAVSRAFALQYAYQMYAGYKNPELLRPFFTDDQFKAIDFSKPLSSDLIKSIHETIYALTPLPLTTARLASMAWKNGDTTSAETYMKSFQTSVEKTAPYEGMSSLLPVAYLVAANLSANMEKGGLQPEFGAPPTLYEIAITKAEIAKIESTHQFGLLDYANYLAYKNDIKKSTELLGKIVERGVHPMLRANARAPEATEKYASLLEKAKKNADLKKLLDAIGFPSF